MRKFKLNLSKNFYGVSAINRSVYKINEEQIENYINNFGCTIILKSNKLLPVDDYLADNFGGYEFYDKTLKSDDFKKIEFINLSDHSQFSVPERVFYKRLPRRFYSSKYDSWIAKSKKYVDKNSIKYDFLNIKTTKVICSATSKKGVSDLNKIALELVNSKEIFG